MQQSSAVILANGAFPTQPVPLDYLRRAAFLVCTDGALVRLMEAQTEPDGVLYGQKLHPQAIVGDGDSLPEELKARFAHCYVEYAEQDDNDLTKATRYCISLGFTRIIYLGISGRREDHALANIALLMRYFQEFRLDVCAYTDYGCFIPARGVQRFDAKRGQQVSIFNFGCRTLKSEGLKWEVRPFSALWQGSLNQALGEEFTLSADGDYLVYLAYECKL